jgi:type II secretory pathway pseudopilin PulG
VPAIRGEKNNAEGRRDRGYILLGLLLALALLAIAATVVAPGIAFQVKRDREEELVHRGIQYRRAVRLYVNKTGRYPVTPEALLGTQDARYIRKLYKDPITGGDFQLLHMGDVQPGVGLGTPIQSNQNGGGDGTTQNGESGATGNDQLQGANPPAAPNTDSSQSSLSLSSQQANSAAATAVAQAAATPAPGSQPGLLIFGVASKSKDRTIREFNKKNHYNDWWFFYDPRLNVGYEIKGPTPPAASIPGQVVPPGSQPGSNSSPTPGGAQPQPVQQQ